MKMLYNLSEGILIGATLLMSLLPDKVKNTFEQFGQEIPTSFDKIKNFGFLSDKLSVKKGENIYPRLDVNKEMGELAKMC